MPSGVYVRKKGIIYGGFKKGYKVPEDWKIKWAAIRKIRPMRNWLGKKRSEKTKEKIRNAHIKRGTIPPSRKGIKGDCLYNWKGDSVGYVGLHSWVVRSLGRPTKCEHCGKGGFANSKEHKTIHWANKDHKYKRNLIDWIRLCASCHKIYDRDVLKIKI